MRNASVHIHFVRVTLNNAQQHNLDIKALLSRSRISPQLIQLDDARVSARQFADLQTLTMLAMGDELLGHSPHPVRLGSWSAMCHWLIHTKTLGQTIKRFCRFYGLMERGFRARLTTEGNLAIVDVSPWSEPERHQIYGYELFMFTFHRLLCWMTREKLPIHRMHLPYPRPAHHREYQYMFYGYPVFFDQQRCSISFHRALLAKPVRQDITALTEFLRHPMYEIIVQDHDRSSWSARVRELIARNPAENPGLTDVAATLDTPSHTLRRRLADEGQSYSDLKREVKRDLAIHYLSSRDISVEEVAFKTGFSEASAFIRAFKQWTGVTPYTYRKGR